MKRYVVELEFLYAELLKDAAYAFPTLKREFERDLARLTFLSRHRGLPLFTKDLVALSKHFDKCLGDCQYLSSGLPAGKRVSRSVVIPKLFRGLYLLVFDRNGNLKENADVTAIFFLRQLLGVAKKVNIECPPERTRSCLLDTIKADTEMPVPAQSWAKPDYEGLLRDHEGFQADVSLRETLCAALGKGRGLRLLSQLDATAAAVTLTLGVYNPMEWSFKHGSGACSNQSRYSDRYSFLNWPERLEHAYPSADYAHHDWFAWIDEVQDGFRDRDGTLKSRTSYEDCSRLFAVKKDMDKPRFIAAEPVANMYTQQNLRDYMYRRVNASWIGKFIKFDDQSQNRRLALLGSLDGSVATIDLKAASDSISCQTVGNLFRVNLPLLQALAATRTRFCLVEQEPTHAVVWKLHKYATMGNATTFPVQSLLFLTAALACMSEDEVINPSRYQGPRENGGLVSVFGDDIIVPVEIVGTLTVLLEALGLQVNTTKSYSEGPFRESCGVDAFRGTDVTPAYWHEPCQGSAESYATCVDTSNNFYKKFLVNAASGIEQRTGPIRLTQCQVDSAVFGFETFVKPEPSFPKRFNKTLQRVEFHVPQIKSTVRTLSGDQNTSLAQYFHEAPGPISFPVIGKKIADWSGGVKCRPQSRMAKRWVPIAQFFQTDNRFT